MRKLARLERERLLDGLRQQTAERPYIAYFDGKRFGKPFLLPQRKGNFYENCFRVFNVPTFARETSSLTPQKAAEGKYASAREASIRENLSE